MESGVQGGGTVSVTLIDDILGQSSATTSDFVANSTASGATPTVSDQHDVISNNSPSSGAGLSSGTSILIGDPMLGPLSANGGPTATMALQAGSPALAAGITADYPATSTPITTDQRGDARASTPSVGAYESTLAAAPTITVSRNSLALVTTTAGIAGPARSYTISGTDLTAAIEVAAPNGVQLSDDGGGTWSNLVTLPDIGGTVGSSTIDARISASAAAGSISGTIASTSSGATEKDVAVSGTVNAVGTPTIIVSTSSLALGTTTVGRAGTAQTCTISGVSLEAAITIAAPSGVELSDDGGHTWSTALNLASSGGTVNTTTIDARIIASAGQGNITGNITITSTGATEDDVAVSGAVNVGIETLPGNIVSSLSQSSYGQDVTFTATFSAAVGGSAPMTGTVNFYDGNTYLLTAPLVATGAGSLRGGTSSLSTSSLTIGSHTLTAVYSGDANYITASTDIPVSVEVVPAATSIALTASTVAQGTMITANVVATSPGNPPIVGAVSFYEPGALIGTVPVANGVATLSVGWLPAGSHSFSAVFSGGGTLTASESSLVVRADGPRVTNVARYGLSGQPTYLLLDLNSPLNSTSAEIAANYTIVGPGNQRIKVRLAIYDSVTDTVTLVPKGKLNLRQRYQLKVNGKTRTGLTNPAGALLDGADTGRPGSNFATSVTR